ncbi:hypothetical protein INT47_008595 [Mucor saturninus]|uniref:Uncharacterized protein n=1 Tax=Mucor saturninus TaxID=64648 RepID=A0A8H7RBB4_9FUNG|nr:hypothetical protein INT47_008595 [Mucor saturninus]
MFLPYIFTLLMYAMSKLMMDVQDKQTFVGDYVEEITNNPTDPSCIDATCEEISRIKGVEGTSATESNDSSSSLIDPILDDNDLNTAYQERLRLCSKLQKILADKVKASFADTVDDCWKCGACKKE